MVADTAESVGRIALLKRELSNVPFDLMFERP